MSHKQDVPTNEAEVPPLKLAHIAVCPRCGRASVGMNDCPACGASPTSSIPYVPASALAEVWEKAIATVQTEMKRCGEFGMSPSLEDFRIALEAARDASLSAGEESNDGAK